MNQVAFGNFRHHKRKRFSDRANHTRKIKNPLQNQKQKYRFPKNDISERDETLS